MTENDQGSGAGFSPYTGTGDDGSTTLGNASRVRKSDARIQAFAACEEANAAIGVVVSAGGGLPASVVVLLSRVQNDLVEVGGDLNTPVPGSDDAQRRIDDAYVLRVEAACKYYNEQLPEVSTAVLPGGTAASAHLYQAGTLVRRAERETWRAQEEYGDINECAGRYLNRLADLLFIIGRLSNAEHGDAIWSPGLTASEGLLPFELEEGVEATG